MSVDILFFGELADVAEQCTGSSSIKLPLLENDYSLLSLQAKLGQDFPELGEVFARDDHLLSVNQVMQRGDIELKDGDEVAFMSPFSGG